MALDVDEHMLLDRLSLVLEVAGDAIGDDGRPGLVSANEAGNNAGELGLVGLPRLDVEAGADRSDIGQMVDSEV